jgi:Fe-S-cluster containining protein
VTTQPTEPATFDCRACGACCHAREGTLLVSPLDLVRWKRTGREDILARLEDGHFGETAFAMSERGACVHLGMPGAPYDCSIYETRAVVCRAFEVGNPQCLAARRERGLPFVPGIEGASMAAPVLSD